MNRALAALAAGAALVLGFGIGELSPHPAPPVSHTQAAAVKHWHSCTAKWYSITLQHAQITGNLIDALQQYESDYDSAALTAAENDFSTQQDALTATVPMPECKP